MATLSRTQSIAAGLLARGYSVGVVAERLRMPRRSVFRWKRMPAFAELCRACRALLTPVARRERSNSFDEFASSLGRHDSPAFNALRLSLRFP